MNHRSRHFVYACCCVDISQEKVPALHQMIAESVEVTYRTMLRQCRGLLEWAQQKGYDTDKRRGLTLQHDQYIDYRKSRFRGQPCYYLVWSAIEFIWIRES